MDIPGKLLGGVFCGIAILLSTLGGDATAQAINWSGWYLAGSAGWGWRRHTDYPPDSYYAGLGANFAGGAGYGGSSGGGTSRYNGFAAGFGFGYNYQPNKFLIIGAEYEFLYADMQTNPTSATTSFTQGSALYAPAYVVSNYDSVDGDSNRWYGVGRARIGVPISDRAWIYLTGGAAYRLHYSSQTPSITTSTYTLTPSPIFPYPFIVNTTTSTVTYPGINTSHAWGWVAGTGLEYALQEKIFVRAEWLHMDFGTATYLDPIATALTGTTTVLKFRRTSDILRGGLVYRFYSGGSYR